MFHHKSQNTPATEIPFAGVFLFIFSSQSNTFSSSAITILNALIRAYFYLRILRYATVHR